MVSVWVLLAVVLACFLGPYAFPFTGEDADFDNISAGINLFSAHPFGTDDFGRDLLIRVLEDLSQRETLARADMQVD